jgi:hypothetical protein
MISTTPKGHAPTKKPYRLDNRQPKAKAKVKARCCPSSAYITIMKVHCQDAKPRYRIHLIHTFTVAFAATSGHGRLFGLYDDEDEERESGNIFRGQRFSRGHSIHRVIWAARILAQWVATGYECARPRPTAEVAVRAHATASAESPSPDLPKNRRVSVDLHQASLLHVAQPER